MSIFSLVYYEMSTYLYYSLKWPYMHYILLWNTYIFAVFYSELFLYLPLFILKFPHSKYILLWNIHLFIISHSHLSIYWLYFTLSCPFIDWFRFWTVTILTKSVVNPFNIIFMRLLLGHIVWLAFRSVYRISLAHFNLT